MTWSPSAWKTGARAGASVVRLVFGLRSCGTVIARPETVRCAMFVKPVGADSQLVVSAWTLTASAVMRSVSGVGPSRPTPARFEQALPPWKDPLVIPGGAGAFGTQFVVDAVDSVAAAVSSAACRRSRTLPRHAVQAAIAALVLDGPPG